MAELHAALKILGPTDFSSIPSDDLGPYLAQCFRDGQTLVDSVPIPPSSSTQPPRAYTPSTEVTSSAAIYVSDARTEPTSDISAALQAAWGKPIKLNAKENPHDLSVYKLASKDGRGAWFAQRSVHEGLGFTRWKHALQRELLETMKVSGKPGEGSVRSIGGERVVAHQSVDGVGSMSVYHLSAQFPGPTAARDFVTLLLASDRAMSDTSAGVSEEKGVPRHYMVISKPCNHPDCPQRPGFVRGQYESIEFIREIPANKPPPRSASAENIVKQVGERQSRILETVTNRSFDASHRVEQNSSFGLGSDLNHTESNRQRGKTISFAESRGSEAKGEQFDVPTIDDETTPVEWIMITRSDPGGSVPRFMVERGTPSAMVADAGKFLDWACAFQLPQDAQPEKEASVDDETLDELSKVPESDQLLAATDKSTHTQSTVAEAPMIAVSPHPMSRRSSTITVSSVTSVGTFKSAVEERPAIDSIDGALDNIKDDEDNGSSEHSKGPESSRSQLTLAERNLVKAEEKYLDDLRRREAKHRKELTKMAAKVAAQREKEIQRETKKFEKAVAQQKKSEDRQRRKDAKKEEQTRKRGKSGSERSEDSGIVMEDEELQQPDKPHDYEKQLAELRREVTELRLHNETLTRRVDALQAGLAAQAELAVAAEQSPDRGVFKTVRQELRRARTSSISKRLQLQPSSQSRASAE